MILDLVFAVIIILAIIKGYRRGLIVGIFSFVAIIIGLAAAIKLSTVVADYIGKAVKISEQWLPLISFAVVFFIAVLLVRLGANAIQKAAETIMLGWVNRIGGIIFYIVIYITIFSVVLFYADQIKIIRPATKEKSVTYSYIQPWGPKAINGVGSAVPAFKNMFADLEEFFGGISQKISKR
ncbi:MAG TPA: CvpA family protein [Chitinophagaceae bacterium]|nr:CvpA family protein [Chitinophagaceae bacterium]